MIYMLCFCFHIQSKSVTYSGLPYSAIPNSLLKTGEEESWKLVARYVCNIAGCEASYSKKYNLIRHQNTKHRFPNSWISASMSSEHEWISLTIWKPFKDDMMNRLVKKTCLRLFFLLFFLDIFCHFWHAVQSRKLGKKEEQSSCDYLKCKLLLSITILWKADSAVQRRWVCIYQCFFLSFKRNLFPDFIIVSM